MQKSKLLVGLGLLAGIVILGVAIGWWATLGTITTVVVDPGTSSTTTEIPVSPSTSVPRSIPRTTTPTNARPLAAALIDSVPEVAPEMTSTNWEDKLDEILSSEADDTNKVHDLLAMFPTVPPEGQEELAQHLSNLIEDEDYAPLGKLLLDAKLSAEVLDILLADLLNRPNATKLPMFLDLAKNPDHAKAEESRELLELYLDEDYGTDWTKWQSAMKKWLEENPD
ncbi:MAG: hypothetical protein H7Y43_11160 [Akkermansiaceae bacterium]|nr:hypothetical protein [Verrucomicrobiales bacterium]